jgi:hypothetical protein
VSDIRNEYMVVLLAFELAISSFSGSLVGSKDLVILGMEIVSTECLSTNVDIRIIQKLGGPEIKNLFGTNKRYLLYSSGVIAHD